MINANNNSETRNIKAPSAEVALIDWSAFRSSGINRGYDVMELCAMSADLSVSHL